MFNKKAQRIKEVKPLVMKLEKDKVESATKGEHPAPQREGSRVN